MKQIASIFTICAILFYIPGFGQNNPEPWKPDQLIAPEVLATTINSPAITKPLIISIGPSGLIKGAINIGPVNKKENLNKLNQFLAGEKKDREVIVYCGCCPYKNCPNIRPAFSLLNSLKFTNHKLLDLPRNLKVDWIDHGYPMND